MNSAHQVWCDTCGLCSDSDLFRSLKHLGGRGVAALLESAVPMWELLAEISNVPVAKFFSCCSSGRPPTIACFCTPSWPELHVQHS